MLRTDNLGFSYKSKRNCTPIFSHLNIEFTTGLNVILGPNGAGKSTLLKSIFGLLRHEGTVWYGNQNLTKLHGKEKTKLMSYLPQMDVDFSTLTVFEMVLLGRLPDLTHRIADEDLISVTKTLSALNIEDLTARPFSELSGGQKKMVFLAQTLVREPQVLLLDEPVNSLDLQKQLELCELLCDIVHKNNANIIMVLHDINLAARFADYLHVLNADGTLYACGTPYEVVTKEMIRDVYGVVASITHDENKTPLVSAIRSVRSED